MSAPGLIERGRQALERALLDLWFPVSPSWARSLIVRILAPLAWLTGRVAGARRARIVRLDRSIRPAVIVVGNLIVGGAGKSPVVAALVRALVARGWRVGIVARGYRAAQGHARLVGPDDDAAEQGDEPVMLARATGVPVACAVRRADAQALLQARHPDIDLVISDDGLQHAGLARSLELVVFDSRGAGNRRLLPAGPLREPLSHLATMDAIVWRDTAPVPLDDARLPAAAFPATTRPIGFRPVAPGARDRLAPARFAALCAGRRVVALAGIARPRRFFEMLEGCAIPLAGTLTMADHAPAGSAWLPHDADLIVMTAKDAVKFGPIADERCWYLEIDAELDPAFIDWLEDSLRGPSTH